MKFKRFVLTHGDHQVPYGLLAMALQMIEGDDSKGRHVMDFGMSLTAFTCRPISSVRSTRESVSRRR